MARPRSDTATLIREGHSISLKVFPAPRLRTTNPGYLGVDNSDETCEYDRLSRPSLTEQSPLPRSNVAGIPQKASLAYPSTALDGDYILTPILSLPPSFGSAYIGETFSCTIVANNELSSGIGTGTSLSAHKSIANVKLVAEMQTPSQTVPLELIAESSSIADETSKDPQATQLTDFKPGQSVQCIIEFPLREEGSHTLIVGVYYTEITGGHATDPNQDTTSTTDTTATVSTSSPAGSTPITSRARTFRKMYQFPTAPSLSVRTKATELPPLEIPDKTLGDPYGRITLLRYVLEAQLENVSEARIMLEKAVLLARPPFKATGMNGGDLSEEEGGKEEAEIRERDIMSVTQTADSSPDQVSNGDRVVLQPRSVHQLLFHVIQQANVTAGLDELKAGLKTDGRAVLGQIALEWRSAMGEKGGLSTGNLMSRRRQ